MAVNISVNNNKQIKEGIKLTSIVRSKNEESDNSDVYMIMKTHIGMYALLDLKTGVCYAPHQNLADLIDNFDLELITNDISVVLNNPIVDIKVGE